MADFKYASTDQALKMDINAGFGGLHSITLAVGPVSKTYTPEALLNKCQAALTADILSLTPDPRTVTPM